MNAWLIGSLVTAVVTVIPGLVWRAVWLAGLYRVLRDTRPAERPEILQVYLGSPIEQRDPPHSAAGGPS
ncbi:hypothetical protein ACNTMW_23135 [Planosporangium sp. 12N6]|uniref:hypothetical protein n=1 Tax=Planosporangium spinosum TaxID=3402278 RepID=UPI003CF9283E